MGKWTRGLLLAIVGFASGPLAAQELVFRGTFENEGSTPLALAQVELRASNETVKATAVTDIWGTFPPFSTAQMVAGDTIVAFGGTWGPDEFSGEFRLPVDSPGVSQSLNPVTTLVHAVAQSSLVTDAPPGRLINAVNLLTARGLIDADWPSGSSVVVDSDLASHIVAGGGMQTWAAALVVDLADGDLDRAWMVSFPHVHGGVANVDFGPSASEWLRGDAIEIALDVERTLPAPVAGYSFSKQLGADWVSVSPAGVLTANVPNDAPNGPGTLRIRVLNPESNRFRDVELTYQIVIGTVVAQATYGTQGGTLWVPGNSIGIQVPDNAFSASTGVEWVSYGEGQSATYRMRTNPRDRTFLLAPTLLTPTTSAPESPMLPTLTCSLADANIAGWGSETWSPKGCGKAIFAEVRPGVWTNRLPANSQYTLPAGTGFQLNTSPPQLAWVLGGRCNTGCFGTVPVLFVHGYTLEGEIGGGHGTWGDLPDLLHGQAAGASTLAAYQFRYRSNARFQDLAADLQIAIDAIYQETGQPVHIVAHSFGGLVARTYLQGLIPGTPTLEPPPGNCTTSRHPKVASLTTLGTPHSGVAVFEATLHGRLLPIGRHGLVGAGIGICRQSSCWQAGEYRPFANGTSFLTMFGVEAEPGFIPARLSDFATYPLPVPTLNLIGLMPEGSGFDDGDNLISYQGQRFSPRQSCSAGSCSNSTVVQPAITNIEGTAVGHCVYERVLGTVINNAAPLPGLSNQRVQTMLQTYAHSGAVLPGGASPEVEVSRAQAGDNDLDLATHDTVHRLRDWLLRLREPDPASRILKVNVSGAGAVEVDLAGSIQSCSGSCDYTAVPAQIRIRAAPAGGVLYSMTPSPCGGSALNWCDWRVGPYERVTAQFQTSGQGSVRVTVGGSGRVRVNPGNLLCGGVCNYLFAPLTSVSLAAEGTGGAFNGWSGNCSGSNATCTVTAQANQPRVVGAAFGNPVSITTKPLNDTGQSWCGNNTTGNLNCPQAGFPHQDGDHGRDALARAGLLSKIGGGESGFDYTKISNSGVPLQASAALGSGPNDWACTRDNITGLIWEVKVNNLSSLRHMNHTYTWYETNPAINGGNPGSQGTSGTCNGTLPLCNTSAFVAAVNSQGLCGYSDWRMPDQSELLGILDYGRTNPTIDPTYFVNTVAGFTWTGRNLIIDAASAWRVLFASNTGNFNYSSKSANQYVRLVRSEQ